MHWRFVKAERLGSDRASMPASARRHEADEVNCRASPVFLPHWAGWLKEGSGTSWILVTHGFLTTSGLSPTSSSSIWLETPTGAGQADVSPPGHSRRCELSPHAAAWKELNVNKKKDARGFGGLTVVRTLYLSLLTGKVLSNRVCVCESEWGTSQSRCRAASGALFWWPGCCHCCSRARLQPQPRTPGRALPTDTTPCWMQTANTTSGGTTTPPRSPSRWKWKPGATSVLGSLQRDPWLGLTWSLEESLMVALISR